MKDLSDNPFAKHSLVAGSSMAAGNTVNDVSKQWNMSAPGSDPVDPLPANDAMDDPEIDAGPVKKQKHMVAKDTASSVLAAPHEWKKV